MSVLCLHGKGTSGTIFKSQTATFRSHLNDLHIDFDFIDGCYPSTAAAGIDLFYPAPYYSFWEERGPYDAVMMFSQGCALGTAMLLLDQAQDPRSLRRVGAVDGRCVRGGAVDEEELRGEIRGPFKVGIPTVHVYGSKDPRYAAGVQLSGICEPGKRRVFDHGGGHEIPRTDRVSRTIADLGRA
ncbi:putative EF-hand calcium-binding domain protein [Aspergillus novofumigatus IBT 16806]|uniref:Serine hydrolase domain-containing protein n=1 Tax=Aspergillus novofumigatus (strain IBT 16806) TaxID=1392255 RepID=A0A2I1CK73_ASPN1|nr:uncharacterized protein P174DRAFT_436420 [Aspergillus novofumigatus IBT 16806]PKX98022.1 hypothetical protein P174DRAFT_436420 [Aspergillus novofumigatus IBT 16806]